MNCKILYSKHQIPIFLTPPHRYGVWSNINCLLFFFMWVYFNTLEICLPCCKFSMSKLFSNQQHHAKPNTKQTYIIANDKQIIPAADANHAIIENAIWNPFLKWFWGSLYDTIPRAPATYNGDPPAITPIPNRK